MDDDNKMTIEGNPGCFLALFLLILLAGMALGSCIHG